MRAARLLVPAVGAVALLSAVPAGATGTAIHLVGSASGSWTTNVRPGVPDAGATYTLAGTSRTNYGGGKVRGVAHGTGFIRNAHCTATLSIGGSTGRATIDITSTTTVDGGSTCQGGYPFTWSVEKGSGTGQLAGRTGKGSGTLDVTATNTFTVTFSRS